MRASDLQEDYPAIDYSESATRAARSIGAEHRPAVVVLDQGKPLTVLPASQVLTFLIPAYLREDPSLVRVYDEESADKCVQQLEGKSVRDLLPRPETRLEPPVVEADATVLEVAALMAKLRTPLVVVVDDEGQMTGAITAGHILETLVP